VVQEFYCLIHHTAKSIWHYVYHWLL